MLNFHARSTAILRMTVVAALAILAACSPDNNVPAVTQVLSIRPVSNQSHLISGGNILVEINSSSTANQLQLQVDGKAITASLSALEESAQ